MSAVPTVSPDVPATVPATRVRRRAGRPPGTDKGFLFPTLFMLAFLVYFLMPLAWLVIASTKSIDDLFDSFGLWFAHFNLIDNVKDTFTKDDGVYGTWLRNTIVYSAVSAVGAALLAAAAGYGFAKFAFRLMVPGFVTVLLFTFVATWNNYFLPLVMLSEPGWYPLTVGLAQWNDQANASGGSTAAFNLVITGSLISVVPLIIAFLFLQRFWQSGLSAGSVKG